MTDYSINAITRKVSYSGSAGVGPYAFTFEIINNTDLAVYKNEFLLTVGSDYTVTINPNGTGSVTLTVAASIFDTIVILGARDIERTTDFVTAGDLRAESLNEQLDSLVIFDQQIDERVDRSIRAPAYDPTGIDMTLPSKDDRANGFLRFNNEGNPQIASLADFTINTTNTAVDEFTGNGSTTAFTLSVAPGSKSNTSVYIDGLYQEKENYTVSGTTMTFDTAPPDGSSIEATSSQALFGIDDAANVSFNIGVSGAVDRTVESKLKDFVSVKDYGAKGDGVTNDTQAIQNAIVSGKAVYFPESSGRYLVTEGIDCQQTVLRIYGHSPVLYTNAQAQGTNPCIQFSPTVDDTALFYNFFEKGTHIEGVSVEGPSASQDSGTRIVSSNVPGLTKIDFLRTDTSDGQYWMTLKNMVIRSFCGAGVRFRGESYNWIDIQNIKFSQTKWGFKYEGGSVSHMASFRRVHFANTEVGVMGTTEDYDLDNRGLPRFLRFEDCVFEFQRYGVFGGSGYNGQSPIHFENCWFESIADAAWHVQDFDVTYNSIQRISAPAGITSYGASRSASNRYNQSTSVQGITYTDRTFFNQLRQEDSDGGILTETTQAPGKLNLGTLGQTTQIVGTAFIETHEVTLAPSASYTFNGNGGFVMVKGYASGTKHRLQIVGYLARVAVTSLFNQGRNGLDAFTIAIDAGADTVTVTNADATDTASVFIYHLEMRND